MSLVRNIVSPASVIEEELAQLANITEKFNVWYESNLEDIKNKTVEFTENNKNCSCKVPQSLIVTPLEHLRILRNLQSCKMY